MWVNGLRFGERSEEVVIDKGFICVEGSTDMPYGHKDFGGNPFDRDISGGIETFLIQRIHEGYPMAVSSSSKNRYYGISPLRKQDYGYGDGGMKEVDEVSLNKPAQISYSLFNDSVAFFKAPYVVRKKDLVNRKGVKTFVFRNSFDSQLPVRETESWDTSVIYVPRGFGTNLSQVYSWSEVSNGQIINRLYSWLHRVEKIYLSKYFISSDFAGFIDLGFEESRNYVRKMTHVLEKRFGEKFSYRY